MAEVGPKWSQSHVDERKWSLGGVSKPENRRREHESKKKTSKRGFKAHGHLDLIDEVILRVWQMTPTADSR